MTATLNAMANRVRRRISAKKPWRQYLTMLY